MTQEKSRFVELQSGKEVKSRPRPADVLSPRVQTPW
jgi:hypothetical protein